VKKLDDILNRTDAVKD